MSCQGQVKVRSMKGQGHVKVILSSGQDESQGQVKVTSMSGQSQVKVRSRSS